jgi:PPOX class probable F420-dependent enzyme
MADTDRSTGFGPLESSKTALLSTYRSSGEPVSTPVSIAVRDGKAYFVTAADSGKARRLAGNPEVTLAPCTVSGKVTGETVMARARLVDREERTRVTKGLLKPTGGLFWSLLAYRLFGGKRMVLFEVVPVTSRG